MSIHAESYVTHFGVHRDTAYQALKDACENLFNRQFSYIEERLKGLMVVRSRWVSQVSYIESEASVALIFAPAVIPLITRLEKHFTSYALEQVQDLSSAYAVRLYELLIAWRSVGKTPMISLEEFRQKLGVLPTEYSRMFDFKKYVLNQALKQINTHTDIFTTVEQHKNGRNVVGFSFSFKQKQPQTAVQLTPPIFATTSGTQYIDQEQNIWTFDDHGFLFCAQTHRSMPPFLAYQAIAQNELTPFTEGCL